MEEKDQILVCEECGSHNVETQAWVKVNENNKCSDYLGIDDDGNNWCNDCQEHVPFITLSGYQGIENGND
jgi:hypothetical protein